MNVRPVMFFCATTVFTAAASVADDETITAAPETLASAAACAIAIGSLAGLTIPVVALPGCVIARTLSEVIATVDPVTSRVMGAACAGSADMVSTPVINPARRSTVRMDAEALRIMDLSDEKA
ncbi:hypothetical protein ASC55_08565 [Microbacterium sp. Root322]|nr:hypothetical protein ASC55_08565 [Microbacterium sp. Root322]